MNIEILEPIIFPKENVISGVTLTNHNLLPDQKLTFSTMKETEENTLSRKLLAKKLNTSVNSLKFQLQTHSDIIQIIEENSTLSNSDSMITNQTGIVLNVLLADCLGVLLYDKENSAIAAIHSGWRGTQQRISEKTINKMNQIYATKPENLLVYLSPCASGEKYEVQNDVAKYFPNHSIQISDTHYLFNNRQKVYDDLLEIGVDPLNIEKSTECTISSKNFHSYRRDKDKAGRMSAFIGLV